MGIPLEIEQKLIVFEEFPEETTVTKGVGDGVGVREGVLVGDGKGVADNDGVGVGIDVGVGDGVKEGVGLIIISLSDSI